jgi:Calcineurin-like phosphoesterase
MHNACGRTRTLIKLSPYLSSTVSQGRFLFPGNYVDRGDHQLQVVSLLLIMKVRFPNSCFLLRGHHEARTTNGREGVPNSFLSQCKAAFTNGDEGERVCTMFNDAFDYLPIAAEIAHADGRTFHVSSHAFPRTVLPPAFERMCLERPRPFTVQEGTVFHEVTFGALGFEE